MNALVVGNFEFGEVVVGHCSTIDLFCGHGLCLSMILRGKRASKDSSNDASGGTGACNRADRVRRPQVKLVAGYNELLACTALTHVVEPVAAREKVRV
ncbi:hypothetical protein GE21DRAFT_9024 [Neurospora crassa]|uniref:Uncharacterized protein n=1 Tax=Neurospora crassa (strain ATCC 24698 / 74-OR23-1A / CBS 708.71 / DSM 1257 / FGSC 987) TaxID=367110 RepID=Q7S6T4_NEUCR|nr:hypothetical protein NCU05505 [Neurospora crassa OR74A]EAA31231.1 hypothetical protein NCU05505 [Neurospora crassa OR74A]KHE81648.1 hypothetical protein GE21DRAFT_9024 [Neurospora crassa]|eukprot:XP_960467.1 hypothetical protein NCU05505 [Neurospora crassa OR74A]